MGTFYRETIDGAPSYPPLTAPIETEVAVIGGGFAGPGTALSLADRGHRNTVLPEAEVIGHGARAATAASSPAASASTPRHCGAAWATRPHAGSTCKAKRP